MASAFTVASHNAKLVALRIGQDHPTGAIRIATISYLASAKRDYANDLFVSATIGRSKIEMDPILERLSVGDLDEQQGMTRCRFKDRALLVARFVGVARHVGIAT
jgi:hypothetical protein